MGASWNWKTYTMSQIAKLYMKQGKSILIVSHSNVSVDGVIKKIVEILDKDMMLELQKRKNPSLWLCTR